MNSIPRVVLVWLLASGACYADKFLPRGSGPYKGLSRRQDSGPPTCNPCTLPPLEQLQPAIDLMKEVGQIVQAEKDDFNIVFSSNFQTVEDLKSALDTALNNVEERTFAIAEKLIAALENTESCPPLQNLFEGLQENFDKFLETLETKWKASVTDTDVQSTLAALAVAMVEDIPAYFVLIRDLLVYSVDVFLTDDCENFAPTINNILDPHGDLSKAITDTSIIPGDAATNIGLNILGGLIPGGGGGGLDYLHIIAQLLCGALYKLQPDTDLNEATSGFCQNLPDISDYSAVIKNILCAAISVVGHGDQC